MTKTLSTAEIKKRSISGAKWLIVMNGLGIPAAFLVALLLGRVGPEVLGAYALVQILVGVITTFVVYGGAPVLSVFMPKIPGAEDRGRFLFSYLLILLAVMAVVLGLFRLFPQGFEFLLRQEFDMGNYGWFILLALVIVTAEMFANIASGLMLIKVTAIARQMMRLVLLPLVVVLFFLRPDILTGHAISCILGGFLFGYLFAAVICLIGVVRDPRFAMRPGWLLPRGFWAFSLSTMFASIFTFLYGNIDRIAVLSIQDVRGLGMYQAVLSINAFVELIPAILLPSIIPTFSNLMGAEHQTTFNRAFSVLSRWSVVPVTIVSLGMMGFSREILAMFGQGYTQYAYLLTLFGLVGILRSLSLPSLVILTCTEKNLFRFMQNVFLILIQGGLTFGFMSQYGVLAIAGAKMISVVITSVAGVCYVFLGIYSGRQLPLSYKVAVLTGAAVAFLNIAVIPAGWFGSTVLTVFSIMIFMIGSRCTLDEIRGIARFVVHHDTGALTKYAREG